MTKTYVYRLVQLVEGKLDASDFTGADNAIAAMAIRGFAFESFQKQHEHGIKLREDLVGQPVFKKVIGPMWGGELAGVAVIRYETAAAYDLLST